MVYAYIRVSTEMQSYDSQEYEIIQFCKAKGITVDKWVLESVSGTTAVEKRTLGKTFRRWDEISAMIDKGIPMSQIARCVGVHRNTLRKYIERFSKDE